MQDRQRPPVAVAVPADFMWLDLMLMAIRRNPRVPPALQRKYERIEFVTIINGNL